MSAIILISPDSQGIYIPQNFAKKCEELTIEYSGESSDLKENLEILISGPENDLYWDAWQEILDNTKIVHHSKKWFLHQDGDLWAVDESKRGSKEVCRAFGWDFESPTLNFTASYIVTRDVEITLPDDKDADDIENVAVKWDGITIQFTDGTTYKDEDAFSGAIDNEPDYKRPSNIFVSSADNQIEMEF